MFQRKLVVLTSLIAICLTVGLTSGCTNPTTNNIGSTSITVWSSPSFGATDEMTAQEIIITPEDVIIRREIKLYDSSGQQYPSGEEPVLKEKVAELKPGTFDELAELTETENFQQEYDGSNIMDGTYHKIIVTKPSGTKSYGGLEAGTGGSEDFIKAWNQIGQLCKDAGLKPLS
jgi:hypothetical protein